MNLKKDLDANVYNKNSTLQKEYSQIILNKLNFVGNEHILDVGCGDGVITKSLIEYIPRGTLTGIDCSPKMIEFSKRDSKKNSRIKFICMNAEELNLNKRFNLVFSFSCFHWIKDKKKALNKIEQHMETKGKLFILSYLYSSVFVEPIRNTLQSDEYRNLNIADSFLEHFATIEEYKRLGAITGLDLIEHYTLNKSVKFPTLEIYADHFKGFHPVTKLIPKDKIKDFFKKASQKAIKYANLNPDGSLNCLLPTIVLTFTKKIMIFP